MTSDPNETRLKPELIRLSEVTPEEVEWLWPNRIAIGKVTLLAGDPGLGKSLATLAIASAVSRGAPWPDAPHIRQSAGGVVLLSAEDDLADTIRPRLDANGADCERIVALSAVKGSDEKGAYRRPFDLTRDIARLADAIDAVRDCRAAIVDPISAYMGKTDSHKNADVRAALTPLAELAAEKRVAILAVTHLTKGDGAALYRAMGSLAFIAAARAAWVICPCKVSPRRRLMLPLKNNLGPDAANGLAFTVESVGDNHAPVVCWESQPVNTTADEAITFEPRKRGPLANEREQVEHWLRTALVGGPRPAKDVTEEAVHGRAFSKRTLDRARRSVGVLAYRPENPGPWWWRLPEVARHRTDTEHNKRGNLGNVPKNKTIFDSIEAPNSTLPVYAGAGAQPSANGHSSAETEWL